MIHITSSTDDNRHSTYNDLLSSNRFYLFKQVTILSRHVAVSIVPCQESHWSHSSNGASHIGQSMGCCRNARKLIGGCSHCFCRPTMSFSGLVDPQRKLKKAKQNDRTNHRSSKVTATKEPCSYYESPYVIKSFMKAFCCLQKKQKMERLLLVY